MQDVFLIDTMMHLGLILLRALGRNTLLAVALVMVLVAPLPINCVPCVNTSQAPSAVTVVSANDETVVESDAGIGDPMAPQPQQCDHCHCTAPAAIVSDHGVRFPATLVSRHTVRPAPTQIPDDPVFVPDPPPNRA